MTKTNEPNSDRAPQRPGVLPPQDHELWGGRDTVYLAEVVPQGEDKPVPVVFDGRAGNKVFVRRLDPGDPKPSRIPVHPGDEVILMTAISHAALAMTDEVGRRDDLLTSMRVIPVERQGNHIFGRVLGFEEEDDGRRVHLRPGDSLTLSGKAIAQLELVDSHSRPDETGYAPLADTVWTWLRIARFTDEGQARYLVAAARRLDSAERAFRRVATSRQELEKLLEEDALGPKIRVATATLIGEVETAVIAFGRAVDMVAAIPKNLRTGREVPSSLIQARHTVKEIRDAYEHIDERAFGRKRQRGDTRALTIFDYEKLFEENRITYGQHSLGLDSQVPNLLMAAREYLKKATGDVTAPSST